MRTIITATATAIYYDKFGWSDTIFDTVDWDKNGIQWLHKFTVENYQGERECNNDIIIMTKGVPYVGTPVVDKKLYDILQEGIMAYFLGECMTNTMIGWDNILLRKFTKQWKIQQRAYVNRKRPCGIQHSMQEN